MQFLKDGVQTVVDLTLVPDQSLVALPYVNVQVKLIITLSL